MRGIVVKSIVVVWMLAAALPALGVPVLDQSQLDGAGGAGRHPGGYEAWDAARRTKSATPVSRGRSTPKASARDQVSGSSKRSRSTLRHLIAELDKQMESLTAEREEVETALADVAAGSDHQQIAELGTRLEALNVQVAAAEERWLELSTELEQT